MRSLSTPLTDMARGFASLSTLCASRLGAIHFSIAIGLMVVCGASPVVAAPATVFLEEMTSTEVKNALAAGFSTVIIPVGGTEQNGPHIALGKHNVRVRALAAQIARQLETALVAPVLAYVPEGSISPPSGHMRFAGTISVSDEAFKGILQGAASSFRQHGFRDIVLLGDHGGYQGQMRDLALQLNRAWSGSPARVHFIAEYYGASQGEFSRVLRASGLNDAQIGSHGGAADTSLTLAVHPSLVRPEMFESAAQGAMAVGVQGDPRAASAALGQNGVEIIVKATVAAIRRVIAARH